jgi:hypothetical protein
MLTAPASTHGRAFVEWVVNGEPVPYGSPTTLVFVDDNVTSAYARYEWGPDDAVRINAQDARDPAAY